MSRPGKTATTGKDAIGAESGQSAAGQAACVGAGGFLATVLALFACCGGLPLAFALAAGATVAIVGGLSTLAVIAVIGAAGALRARGACARETSPSVHRGQLSRHTAERH